MTKSPLIGAHELSKAVNCYHRKLWTPISIEQKYVANCEFFSFLALSMKKFTQASVYINYEIKLLRPSLDMWPTSRDVVKFDIFALKLIDNVWIGSREKMWYIIDDVSRLQNCIESLASDNFAKSSSTRLRKLLTVILRQQKLQNALGLPIKSRSPLMLWTKPSYA